MRERSKLKDFTKCIACLCNNCKTIRAKLQDYTAVNLVQDDMIMNLCDTFDVNNTHRGASYDPKYWSPCDFGWKTLVGPVSDGV